GTLAGAFEGQLDLGERLRTGGHELVVLSRLPRRKRLSVESRTRLLYVRPHGGPTEGGSDDTRAIPAAPCGCGADRAFPGRGRAGGAAGRRGRGRREGALRPVTGTRGTAQLLRRVHGDLGRGQHEARLRRPVPEQRAEHRGRPLEPAAHDRELERLRLVLRPLLTLA